MSPYVGPIPGFLAGWILAAALFMGSAVWLMRRAGFTTIQIWLALGVRVLAVLVGSKILYLLEAWPTWAVDSRTVVAALFSTQLRIPGGILLVVLIGPWVAHRSGISYLRLADTIVPAAGLALFGVRIGCFLEGCCHGTLSDLPWAVRFPLGTEAHLWQAMQTLIPRDAPTTLPAHPLQLYFALVGVFIFAALTLYQERKRYNGELLLAFALLYLWSTWLLEFLRAWPHELTHHVVLALATTTTIVAAIAEWRYWSKSDQAAPDSTPNPESSATEDSR
jgi:phosphatidylglycerol:prolipoprotein diacylglycerol transferase